MSESGTLYAVLIPIAGTLHAIYPTAQRTFCLIERGDGELWEVDPHRHAVKLAPTCAECLRVVGEWISIQGTGIPTSWRRRLRLERTAGR